MPGNNTAAVAPTHVGIYSRPEAFQRGPHMTYDEFKRHVYKAGLSVKDFAELLRLRSASVTNYARNGKVPDHLAIIAVLLGEMEERGIDFKKIMERVDVEPKRARGAGKGTFGGSKQEPLFDSRGKGDALD